MQILKKIAFWRMIIVLLTGSASLSAQTPVAVEYQLKAAFLFNFTKFVEWPADVYSSDQDPFVIGILGGNPFGSFLEDVAAGEKVNGHPLVISYFKNTNEIKRCQILFINKTGQYNVSDILSDLKGKSVLTVGDTPDFLKLGGMVRFFINASNKVQLQLNPDIAKTVRLQISSKLLRLTEIYTQK